MTPIFAFAGMIQPFGSKHKATVRGKISGKACRGAGGTGVYARTRARAVPLRRRRVTALVFDRMILDDRLMSGHIDAVPASVNAPVHRRLRHGLILLPFAWHI
jgi:hypothetical protein